MADIFDTASNLLQQSPLGQATKQVLGGLGQVVKSIPKEVIDNFKKLAPIPAPVKYPDVPAIHNISDAVIKAPEKSIMFDWKKPEVQQGQEYLSAPSPDSKPLEEPTDWSKGISNMFEGVISKDAPVRPLAEKIKNTTTAFATDPVNAMQGVYSGFNQALYDAVGNTVGLFDKQTGENIKREIKTAMDRPLNAAGKETQDVGYMAFQVLPYGYARHLAMATKFPGVVEPIINAIYTGVTSNDGQRLMNAGLAAGLTGLFNYISGSPAVNPNVKQTIDELQGYQKYVKITPDGKLDISSVHSRYNELNALVGTKGGMAKPLKDEMQVLTQILEGRKVIAAAAPMVEKELSKYPISSRVISAGEKLGLLESPLNINILKVAEKYMVRPSKVVDIIEQEIKLLPSGSNIMDHATKTQEILNNPEPFLQKYAMATGGKDQFGKMTMLKPKEGDLSAMPSVTDLGVSIPAAIPTADNILYRWTGGVSANIPKDNIFSGVYTATDKNRFSHLGGELKEYTVPNNINLKQIQIGSEDFSNAVLNRGEKITAELKNQGYDGVRITGHDGKEVETIIFDDNNLIPASSPLLAEAKKYSTPEEFVKAPLTQKKLDILRSPEADKYEYHLSVEPNLVEGKSFAEQKRTVSEAGERGYSAGDGIYSTKQPQYWESQLAYEGVGSTPTELYLVKVKEPAPSLGTTGQQTVSNPKDVVVVKKILSNTSNELLDIGKAEAVRNKEIFTSIWNQAHGKTPTSLPTATGGRPIQPGDISQAAEEKISVKTAEQLQSEYKQALVKPTGKEVPITFNVNRYGEAGEATKEIVNPEEMTRQVKPDELLRQNAEQLLSTKGAVDKILSSKIVTDEEQIALTYVVKELNKRRATALAAGKDVADLNNQIAKVSLKQAQIGTETGRALRAMGDITDLKFDDPAFWYRKATAVKGSELTPEEIGKVSTMVDQAKQSDNAKYALLQYVSDLEPHSLIQKLAELRKAGMLSGLKTHIRNILGNTIFAGAENIKQPISVALDKLASLYSGKRSVAMPSAKAQAKGAIKGLKEGIGDYKKGFTTTNVATQYEIPRSLANKPNTIPGKFVRIVYGALQTEDRIAFTSAFDDSISQQARVMVKNGYNDTVQNLIANPTQEMQTEAMSDALYRTFQDDNKAVNMMKGIKKAMDKLGVDNVGLGELILPFPKTPTNILNRMVAYSPLGTIKVARDAYKFFRSPDYKSQKKFVEGFGRVLVGSTVAAISAYLASQGIITGKEKDYEKSKIEQRIGGGNYKINISALTRLLNGQSTEWQQGDNVASYDWALPMSGLAVFGSNLGMRDLETAGEGMDATINSLIEQPLLKGVKTLIAKQSDKWSGVTDTLNSLASSLVPSFIGQFKGFTDNASRDIQTPVDALMSRIPGLSNVIRPKLDEFGRPVTYQEDPNPFFKAFNVLLNPAIATYYDPQTQRVEQELLDIDYNFSVPTENITLSNKETKEKLPVTLDNDMYYDYQKALGARKLKVAEALIESDEYNDYPVEERKKIFMNYMQEASKRVKEFYALKQLKKDGRISEYKDWKAIYRY